MKANETSVRSPCQGSGILDFERGLAMPQSGFLASTKVVTHSPPSFLEGRLPEIRIRTSDNLPSKVLAVSFDWPSSTYIVLVRANRIPLGRKDKFKLLKSEQCVFLLQHRSGKTISGLSRYVNLFCYINSVIIINSSILKDF